MEKPALTNLKEKKSLTKTELAELYDISLTTLRKWLANVPGYVLNKAKLFTRQEINMIYKHLGDPI